MESYMKNEFIDRCDKCKCLVIDYVINFSHYSVTEFNDEANTMKIRLYCPDCMKKLGLVSDFIKDGI